LNSRLKRRLVVVTGVIIVVIIAVLAIVGSSMAHKTITVAEAAAGSYDGQKVQVTGQVVDGSYSYAGDILTFYIYDQAADSSTKLKVVYDQGVSTTFGNEVTAICTGQIDDQGVLQCTDLVTKCPSKYENSTDSLTVEQLLSYGDTIVGNTIKVSGVVKDGTLKPAGQGDRFILTDIAGSSEVSVLYDGALPNDIQAQSVVVITGALNSSHKLEATEVALKG